MTGQSGPSEGAGYLAPAKINLCLHVGDRREDGLHDLHSLVCFADIGDRLRVAPAATLQLEISGPFAEALNDLDPAQNLVLRAARELQRRANINLGARIKLEKNLPVASGIGGGTADGVAALICLRKFWQLKLSDDEVRAIAFELGADGPVCLAPHFDQPGAVVMRGAGEVVETGPILPKIWVCLVNPGVAVSTAQIFAELAAMSRRRIPSQLPDYLSHLTWDGLRDFLAATRNDLEPFVIRHLPVIGEMRYKLAKSPGCLGARMSGSGASVFGLFATQDQAQAAAEQFEEQNFWAVAAKILSSGD